MRDEVQQEMQSLVNVVLEFRRSVWCRGVGAWLLRSAVTRPPVARWPGATTPGAPSALAAMSMKRPDGCQGPHGGVHAFAQLRIECRLPGAGSGRTGLPWAERRDGVCQDDSPFLIMAEDGVVSRKALRPHRVSAERRCTHLRATSTPPRRMWLANLHGGTSCRQPALRWI